jgi:hypothetical protein
MTSFTKGFIVFATGMAFLAFLLNCAANWAESQPSRPDERFKIVDKYGPCDVVRYTPDNSAKYAYFLDCK